MPHITDKYNTKNINLITRKYITCKLLSIFPICYFFIYKSTYTLDRDPSVQSPLPRPDCHHCDHVEDFLDHCDLLTSLLCIVTGDWETLQSCVHTCVVILELLDIYLSLHTVLECSTHNWPPLPSVQE